MLGYGSRLLLLVALCFPFFFRTPSDFEIASWFILVLAATVLSPLTSLKPIEKFEGSYEIGLRNDFGHIRLLVLMAAGVLILFFLVKVYPALPQELGGVRPRLAELDLDPQDVSKETLDELSAAVDSASRATCRSGRVWIYHLGPEDVVISTEALGHSPSPSVLLTLSRDTIKAIRWLEPRSVPVLEPAANAGPTP